MKKNLFTGIYIFHELICLSFCFWYFVFDGYLGYGYGDMFYVLPIVIMTFLSSIAFFIINKFGNHLRLFLGLLFLVIDFFVIHLYFQS